MTKHDPLGFTIAEAVEHSPLSRSAIYEAMKRGDLAAKKSGRRTFILRSELERFLGNLPDYQAA